MSKRYVLVDWLKAACVVFVIITHSDFLNDAMLDKNGLFYLLCVNKAVPVFMFLSGFVFALGARNVPLGENYCLSRIVPKLLRLTVPTVIYYIIFVAVMAFTEDKMSLYEIVKRFIAGDFGRGSYYYAVMVQFTLIAPLMYYLIKKYALWGVCATGAVNLLYEVIWTIGDFGDGIYRICALRYLLVIAFGMYLAIREGNRIKGVYITAMAAVGLTYILLPYFTGYEYKIFTVEPWNRSGMMSAFYVASVMYVLFYFFGKAKGEGVISRAVCKVGQASYHIMYTQMFYCVVRPAFDKLIFDMTLLPLWSQYVMDIVVCIVPGLVFCIVDGKILGKFYKTKRKMC